MEWAGTWALHNNKRRRGTTGRWFCWLTIMRNRTPLMEGLPDWILGDALKKYRFFGQVSLRAQGLIPCSTSLLLVWLIFQRLHLVPSHPGRGQEEKLWPLSFLKLLIPSLIFVRSNTSPPAPFLYDQMTKQRQFSNEFDVLHLRENNSQAVERSLTERY